MNRVSWGLRKLAGLGPESSPPDAHLVALHLLGDADALELILERHGPAIWRVCRARLAESDADDAFQATVVSFLRGAKSIRSPELLGAWLVRVAALTARKSAGRRRTQELVADTCATARGPAEVAADRDALARVVAEVARLPAKSRAVFTLCVIEGHTAKEAARVLGVPAGTADTRLAAAKATLRKRLTRLGLAPSLLALLADPATSASAARHAARLAELAPLLVRGAPPAILALTVTGGLTMATAKILTALSLVGLSAGAAGWGVWRAGADDKPVVKAEARPVASAKPVEPPKPAEPPVAPPPANQVSFSVKLKATPTLSEQASRTRAALAVPSQLTSLQGLTLEGLFAQIQEQHNVIVRFDYAAMKRFSNFESLFTGERKLNETRVRTDLSPAGLPLRDVLNDVLARSLGDLPLSIRVSGNQILIGPAFIPTTIPGQIGSPDTNARFERSVLVEARNGPPVSAAFRDMTFTQILSALRAQTGENIVVKIPPDFAGEKLALTATFDDVRLATVLEIVADMVELRLVVVGNVFYLTDSNNADRMQEKVNREALGKSAAK